MGHLFNDIFDKIDTCELIFVSLRSIYLNILIIPTVYLDILIMPTMFVSHMVNYMEGVFDRWFFSQVLFVTASSFSHVSVIVVGGHAT